MNCYLFIDFGSTYTKLTLVDIDKEEIVETSKSYSTVETDIIIGYEKALKKLYSKLENDINILKRLACSSASGGLKIISIGLVQELTAEAAKRAALGAGARVIKTYSHNLSDKEISEIKSSNADIILLAGGTDGGNKLCITNNARMIVKNHIRIPVVVAGNKSCNDEIEAIFQGKIEYFITENVMPKINQINVEPARETIRNIFMKQIVNAKGMKNIEKEISKILMPTPASVLKAAAVLSEGTVNEKGIGDLIVLDIGGATTDIHSIGEGAPSRPGVILNGLEEPIAKRTVEGDLGMRYSALSILEAAGKDLFKRYIDLERYDIEAELENRYSDTSFVAKDKRDILFDEGMAKICGDIAMTRHVGRLESIRSPLGDTFVQKGKDMTEVPFIIGTGGVIVNSKNPNEILKSVLYNMDYISYLKPKDPIFLVDKKYILSAMGLLTMIDKDMAVRMLKKYIVGDVYNERN